MKLERVPRRGHTHHVGRTLEWLRKYGFLCAKTEKRALIIRPGMPKGMAMIGPSQDLFGVADIVAVPPPNYCGRKGTWYIQVCARGGGSAHRVKALAAVIAADEKKGLEAIEVLPRLEVAGNRFLIVNYQLGRTIPKGKRLSGRLIWQRRVEEYLVPPHEVFARSVGLKIIQSTAGFVDWTPTDFALVEALRQAQPKVTASRARTATSAALPLLT